MDKLLCPICGLEMNTSTDDGDDLEFQCENGSHERVLVVYRRFATYVHLGGGCYVVDSRDNISCEKAISRMKKEYDWNTGFTNGV